MNGKHYKECVENRGLDPSWILVNSHSVTANEATPKLGYIAKSDGILLEGSNHQIQLKPDNPWKADDETGKPPKYRSPLGEYDAMLPTHPTNSQYWNDINALKQRAFNIDGHPCLVITEGFFKAIAGCSNNLPTIALLGVEMGLTSSEADLQGKRYLVPALERYAKANFGFIIAFDADCATNPNVIAAQRKLVHQLKLFKAPVYSATGLWTVEQGKGMDDYIQNHGGDRFIKEVLSKAQTIEEWEKQQRPLGRLNKGSESRKEQPSDRFGFKSEIPDAFDPTVEFTQTILRSLFADKPWICINGVLHSWEGTYYKVSIDALELKRISHFCNTYPVEKKGEIRYPFATPGYAKQALEWVKIRLAVDPALVNPAGLNVTNGVLEISWNADQPSWKLEAHTPEKYYTYEPLAAYDPSADPSHCDRLLEALEGVNLARVP